MNSKPKYVKHIKHSNYVMKVLKWDESGMFFWYRMEGINSTLTCNTVNLMEASEEEYLEYQKQQNVYTGTNR